MKRTVAIPFSLFTVCAKRSAVCASRPLADGIGYRDHEVFRHLHQQTKRWFSRPDHSEWPVLVVEDA